MSDLVEQLRIQAEHDFGKDKGAHIDWQAADEIERLRAVNGQMLTRLVCCLELLETNVRTKARDDRAEQRMIVRIRQALGEKP